MTSDLGWETAGQTGLAEAWGPWRAAQSWDSGSDGEHGIHELIQYLLACAQIARLGKGFSPIPFCNA